MNFQINAQSLNRELAALASVAEKGRAAAANPALEFVEFASLASGDVQMTASGLFETLVCVTGGASVKQPGRLLVPARRLYSVTRHLADDAGVSFAADASGAVKVSSGRSNFKLSSVSPGAFQRLAGEFTGHVTLPDSEPLRRALRLVAPHTAGEDDSRYALSSAELSITGDGVVRLAATDNARLAYSEFPFASDVETPVKILIPFRGLERIASLLKDYSGAVSIDLARDERGSVSRIRVSCGERHLTLNLTCGAFPAYRLVLDHPFAHKTVVRRDELLSALKRLQATLGDQTKTVRAVFTTGAIAFSSDAAGVGSGSEIVEAEESIQEQTEIHLALDILLDFLASSREISPSKDARVYLRYTDSRLPVDLGVEESGSGSEFRFIFSPQRA